MNEPRDGVAGGLGGRGCGDGRGRDGGAGLGRGLSCVAVEVGAVVREVVRVSGVGADVN